MITADDYGCRPAYDEGILTAARVGAVDSVSAFALRSALGPEPLLETGVEIGLHLELGAEGDSARADATERAAAAAAIAEQYGAFAQRFRQPPAYLDGHRHGHARDGLGIVLSDFAVAHDLPVRSIGERHRRLLRCRGVPTPDLLIGRTHESEPPLPAELAAGADAIAALPPVVEWMTHPGRRDPEARSRYDRGREVDLELLLGWQAPESLQRSTHRAALSPAGAVCAVESWATVAASSSSEASRSSAKESNPAIVS